MLNRYFQLNIWAVLGLIFIGLLALFGISGQFGEIGADNDDVMRLVQIRDLLAGQSWYDHAQYRMGPEGGTMMHWSRLIDFPVAALIFIFDLFLPQSTAEALAISIWPVMTGLGFILGLHLLQKDYAREDLRPYIWGFGTLILLLLIITFYRFQPGRLDHHNVQLVALGLAYVGLSDLAYKARRFALAGAMTGLSLAIGTEALPFLVVNCAFVAILWAFKGSQISRPVRSFAFAFAAVIMTAFLIDVPPSQYGHVQCDILGVNYLILGLAGCLGLAALSAVPSLNSFMKRSLGLAVLGFICGIILWLTGPECLSNPLGELPVNAQKYWLAYVEEAQPLFSKAGLSNGQFLYYVGFLCMAFGVSFWRYRSQGFTPAHIYGLAMAGAILLMVTYQLRYASFGFIIGTFMLIPWVAERFLDGKAKSKDSVGYIFAIALSCISLWQIPVYFLTDVESEISNKPEAIIFAETRNTSGTSEEDEVDICFPDILKNYLNSTPQQTILGEPNMTADILQFTKHRALNGNYHRNAAGIDIAVKAFLSSPEDASNIMAENTVSLVIFCGDRPAYDIYAKAAKDGLAAKLKTDDLAAPFEKITKASDDHVSVWQLTYR